jgi:O-antigen ligase
MPTNTLKSRFANLFNQKIRLDNLLLTAIFLLITLLYAWFMVRDRAPIWGLIALATLWLLYFLRTGRISPPTPMDPLLLALLMLLPLTLLISADRALSISKIHGLLLGIALFFWIVNVLKNYQNMHWVILGLILLAIGTSLLGLFSADWSKAPTSAFSPIINRLPSLDQILPGLSADPSVNPNTIGGALTFFIPLLTALLLDGGAYQRKYYPQKATAKLRNALFKLLITLALLLTTGTLLLTNSRGAYLGATLGLFTLAIWKQPTLWKVIPILVATAILAVLILSNGDIINFINTIDTDEENATLAGRLESWQNTLLMIQDYPLTGAGIGTYNQLYYDLYALNPFPSEVPQAFHAHNTLLAVAIDLGIPGLVLYSALFSSLGGMVRATYKHGRTIRRVLLKGIACGLVAHLAFGIMDAFLLGTKLGAIFWIFLGMGAGLFAHQENFRHRHSRSTQKTAPNGFNHMDWEPAKRHSKYILIGLGFWLLISLAVASFITNNAILSLSLVIVGGIGLGIFLFSRFRLKNSDLKAGSL